LSFPGVTAEQLAIIWKFFADLAPDIAEQLTFDSKYEVYLCRQAADVAAYRRDEGFALPEDFDYAALPGLSNEVRHKLQTLKPRTIGHAGRIDGVTPAALTLLAAHLRRRGRPKKSAGGAI
jgi:tRNA uridine 5-carboxymethylaminomethyl modification enzyme